jgi:hypothetical protein
MSVKTVIRPETSRHNQTQQPAKLLVTSQSLVGLFITTDQTVGAVVIEMRPHRFGKEPMGPQS